jgi:putative alpha-1,2-mannosidase
MPVDRVRPPRGVVTGGAAALAAVSLTLLAVPARAGAAPARPARPGLSQAHAGLLARAGSSTPALVTDPASFVDPFIGTAGSGNESPGAQAPFGMVTWGPDTPNGGDGGGYRYGDETIDGFSLTHLSGVGCKASGEVPVLPEVGAPNPTGTETMTGPGTASPGFYSVTTSDGSGQITSAFTATQRTGLAQITYPAGQSDDLVLKLSGDQGGGLALPSAYSLWQVSPTELRGSVTSGDFCGSHNVYKVYFDLRFSQAIASLARFSAGHLHPATGRRSLIRAGTSRPGRSARPVPASRAEPLNHPVFHGFTPPSPPALTKPSGAVLGFGQLSSPLLVQVGLSFVSASNAAKNLAAEQAPISSVSFSGVQAGTVSAWSKLLDEIQISGGNTSEDTIFYTALYHALAYPTVFSDDNGQYRGINGKVETVDPGHGAFYTNFSGWDIYRTQAQLLALLDPSVASDVAQSMLDDYQQGGELPKWVEYNTETHVMVGDPADAILGDIYAFGGTSFNAAQALHAMVAQGTYATLNRPGLNYVTSPGYLPINGTYCQDCNYYSPASATLEYATDDFAISQMAQSLNRPAIARAFLTRAQDWRNLFDPGLGLLRARTTSGGWVPSRRPANFGRGFAEGDSWQYTGMVPFNVAGLASAMGGDGAMISYLKHVLRRFQGGPRSSVAAMGNEPSLELPWEYDYVGAPYLTQQTVRAIQDSIWTDTPDGMAGNDDLGTMSAWFVWSALGLYPMTPGTPTLALGSPLFTEAVMNSPALTAPLTIEATGATATDGTTTGTPYVQGMTWQGAGSSTASTWNSAAAPEMLPSGGQLTVTVGANPDTSWGAGAPPPSYGGASPPFRAGVLLSGAGASLCAGPAGGRVRDGAAIEVSACDGRSSQWWYVRANGTIQTGGRCLVPASDSSANGVPAVLAACATGAIDTWQPGPLGTLANAATGTCLGAPGSSPASGTRLTLAACNGPGLTGQRWALPWGAKPPPAGKVRSALGKCLDDAQSSRRDGTKIDVFSCNGTAAQRWVMEPDGTIHSALGGCLDVYHGGLTPGTPIDYFICNNTGSQQWRAQKGGTLVNPQSGLCLTARSARDGTQLVLADCDSARAGQRWAIP